MLMPRSHAWTQRRKWLIVVASAVALVVAGFGVYIYERYYRGPSEELLVGTWEIRKGMIWDPPDYTEFRADHTFWSYAVLKDGQVYRRRFGRWHAAGKNIYFRYDEAFPWGGHLLIWHIVDISDDELRIFTNQMSDMDTYKRVHLPTPKASNQAMQRTAGRPAFPLSMTSTFNQQPRAISPVVADLVSR